MTLMGRTETITDLRANEVFNVCMDFESEGATVEVKLGNEPGSFTVIAIFPSPFGLFLLIAVILAAVVLVSIAILRCAA